jgi:hypothetical protein
VEQFPSVRVEVTDGCLVEVPAHGEVLLNLTDTGGDPFKDSVMLVDFPKMITLQRKLRISYIYLLLTEMSFVL